MRVGLVDLDDPHLAFAEVTGETGAVGDLGSPPPDRLSRGRPQAHDLVADAMELTAGTQGWKHRRSIFHGDPWARQMFGDYRQLAAELRQVQCVGRIAVCWDTSLAEEVWSSLKGELISRCRFADRTGAGVRPATLG